VPLVGDFSGPTTIRSIARYLKEHNANVSAFYASNVETYLDEKQIRNFYASSLSLPTDSTTTTIRYVDFMHNTEILWWNSSLSYLQVVSPMSVLANLASGGKMPAYSDVLRLIPDPSPGRTIPRFNLPANLGPGRPPLPIAINPQAGGVFQTSVPIGTIQVGPAFGLPPAFTVKSMTYGRVNLLRESIACCQLSSDLCGSVVAHKVTLERAPTLVLLTINGSMRIILLRINRSLTACRRTNRKFCRERWT
jgi:hypothetical protein